MRSISTFVGLLTAIAAVAVEGAGSTTKTSTRTIFLPSRATGSATNIYASVIEESSSTTKYLLACQTNFNAPYNCDGDFKGVTLTYADKVMEANFGATEYDCNFGKTAVCETRTTSAGPGATFTLDEREVSSRMTAITILDVDRKKSGSKKTEAAKTTAQNGSGLCKRSSSSGSSGSSGSSSSSSTTTNSKKKKKQDGCSKAASTLFLDTTLWILSLGAIVVMAL